MLILIKFKHSRYSNEFDAYGSFLLSDGVGFGKSILIFGADMNSSVMLIIEILALGKDPP